jgi:hypothetical protein
MNDRGFEEPDQTRCTELSDRLYATLLRATVAAVNSSF